jgi:hypothetical protein
MVYNDYVRQGLHRSSTWDIRNSVNNKYNLCSTYPSILCIPKKINDEQLKLCVKYRSKGRLPAMVWRHPFNGAPLCRASQPMSGISGLTGLSMSTVTNLYYGVEKTSDDDTEDSMLLEAIRTTVCKSWRNITASKNNDAVGIKDTKAKISEKKREETNTNMYIPEKGSSTNMNGHFEQSSLSRSIPISVRKVDHGNDDMDVIACSSSIGSVKSGNGSGSFGVRSLGSSQGSSNDKIIGKSPRGSWISVSESHIESMRRTSRSGLSMLLNDDNDDEEESNQSRGKRDRRVSHWDHVSSCDDIVNNTNENAPKSRRKQSNRDERYSALGDMMTVVEVDGINVQRIFGRLNEQNNNSNSNNNDDNDTKNEKEDDDTMIDPMTISPTLHIIDARPYINAVGNALMGKGVEDCTNKEWVLHFAYMENIHHVRSSFNSLLNVCTEYTNQNINKTQYLNDIKSTLWKNHLEKILLATVHITHVIDVQCDPTLIHCSDGWDRTAQLTSLGQIALDPFYRTIIGFITLIEKEWLSFGHMFQSRNGGHGVVGGNINYGTTIGWHSNNRRKYQDDRSPVFIQFLDCVHQIYIQNINSFEFNLSFLETIARHSCSGWYSTFFGNCEKDRINVKFLQPMESLWDMLLRNEHLYKNKEYVQPPSSDTCKTREEYRQKCVITNIVTSNDELMIWDTLYFGRKRKKLKGLQKAKEEKEKDEGEKEKDEGEKEEDNTKD